VAEELANRTPSRAVKLPNLLLLKVEATEMIINRWTMVLISILLKTLSKARTWTTSIARIWIKKMTPGTNSTRATCPRTNWPPVSETSTSKKLSAPMIAKEEEVGAEVEEPVEGAEADLTTRETRQPRKLELTPNSD
jgi:hypothetical protein